MSTSISRSNFALNQSTDKIVIKLFDKVYIVQISHMNRDIDRLCFSGAIDNEQHSMCIMINSIILKMTN